ncbi:MAG: CCA tRNA nucleotidyltransferase [Pseudomonadota bacterium]
MEAVLGFSISGDWLAATPVQRLLAVLNTQGERALVVGGAIRNALMQRPVSDIDIATTALPDKTRTLIESAGFKAVPTGIEHGTLTAVSGGQGIEITTLRTDVETDGRRAVVAFGRSWQTDAERRDFTMNALYCDADGRVFDPVGGLADCRSRTVRFIGDPDRRLAEDYLRLMRFFRFYAQFGGDTPDPAGLAACIRARPDMRRVSVERIAQEMRKLVVAPGAAAACRLLADTGLAQALFAAAPNPAHLSALLKNGALAEPSVAVEAALAAYLCYGGEGASTLADRLKLSNRERRNLVAISTLAFAKWRAGLPDRPGLVDCVRARGKPIVAASVLVALARGGMSQAPDPNEILAFVSNLTPPEFPLRGRDLLAAGIAPGPGLGALLERAEDAWRASGYSDDRDALLARVRSWAEKT